MTSRGKDKVYIILLNWNGWGDTIECLESVFRNSHPHYQVVVCDNLSHDGSWEQLQDWANGLLVSPAAENPVLRLHTVPPVPKPISYVTYSRSAAENGGDAGAAAARLILIQTGGNLGYSGGNNVGLRFALARNDFSYVWILNNDTVVAQEALGALVARLSQVPDAGLCGSTLMYYDNPEIVQVRGGVRYDRWFATIQPLGMGRRADEQFDHARIEGSMSYPAGASMLVTRDFLREVGLMSESYFLYCEELDWVTRSRGRFKIAYSPKSIVYHKEGRSIAAAATDRPFSLTDFYAHRNRLRYTRRFFPRRLPTVVLRTFAAALARLWRGQPRRAWALLRLTWSRQTYVVPETDLGEESRQERRASVSEPHA
jgi:GT2 family glycosyltransferase